LHTVTHQHQKPLGCSKQRINGANFSFCCANYQQPARRLSRQALDERDTRNACQLINADHQAKHPLPSAAAGRTQLLTKHTQGRTARAARDLIVRAGERQPWDFGRFVSTVTYFNNPAEVIQNVVKSMLGQGSAVEQQESAIITLIAPSQASSAANKQPVVMVTGATGGVGRRVVALLLSKGARVRALARDGDKARSLLGGLRAAAGGSLELVVADITQRPTLLPEFFRGVRALVSCTAVKVQPKEGDADRSKYFQVGSEGQ
jgi:hypothetical protein